MKKQIIKIILSKYILNASDILELTTNNEFKNITKDLNLNKEIAIKSKLIHKSNITLLENIIYIIDNYISFLKSNLFINQLEIRYITSLTIYNKYIFNDKYYYDNIDYYNKIFKDILMNKYINNTKILSNIKKINIYNYENLINKINQNKNRAYIYFENINQNNALYYLNIYEYNDSI